MIVRRMQKSSLLVPSVIIESLNWKKLSQDCVLFDPRTVPLAAWQNRGIVSRHLSYKVVTMAK